VRSLKTELRSWNVVSCYEDCLARGLVRQNTKSSGRSIDAFQTVIGWVGRIFSCSDALLVQIHSSRKRLSRTRSGRHSEQSCARRTVYVRRLLKLPPADALLQRLDRFQPVSGAELIVLSEHVDYWNDIGWKDPYSSHEYSERQSAYAAQFGNGSIYTPQMVIDGRFEFVGSDERRASQAIKEAAKAQKASVRISLGSSDEKATTVLVEAGPLPAAASSQPAGVFLAIADNSDESQVSRGENAGRRLQHVAVLRNLTRVGTVDASSEFSSDLSLDLKSKNRSNLRLVVIIQEPDAGRVLGAGSTRFSN
jgi:hypothetical protein